MKPPTVDEIRAYITETNVNLDAQVFWCHYDQKGWRVGRNPMKRWHSAVGLWAAQGWGKTGRSARDYQKRNQQATNYHQKAREDYGDFLRGKKTRALEDMSKDPGQVPLWLIQEILKEKHARPCGTDGKLEQHQNTQ